MRERQAETLGALRDTLAGEESQRFPVLDIGPLAGHLAQEHRRRDLLHLTFGDLAAYHRELHQSGRAHHRHSEGKG
jgi:hypothetical protein